LVERLQRFASGGGGWVLWLMIALSVVSIAIMFERLIYFTTKRDDVDSLTLKLVALLRGGDLAGATELLKKSKSIEAAVMLPCIEWTEHGPDAFSQVVDAEMTKQKRTLERGTTFLGTIGNNGPFIGLVGTVLGVIQAFQELGSQNKEAMGNVMVGIAEALIATGVGLFVAIPAVVAFNVVNKAVTNVESNVNIMAKYVVAQLTSKTMSDGPTTSAASSDTHVKAAAKNSKLAASPS
ncbi:MAG: MotA/TolQ/ExbB proton channel family protein, partial [Myxococcales bacterium]|nr:MotA/TolQ/ExbB proton channel family protein [Myxococcales bacterium]